MVRFYQQACQFAAGPGESLLVLGDRTVDQLFECVARLAVKWRVFEVAADGRLQQLGVAWRRLDRLVKVLCRQFGFSEQVVAAGGRRRFLIRLDTLFGVSRGRFCLEEEFLRVVLSPARLRLPACRDQELDQREMGKRIGGRQLYRLFKGRARLGDLSVHRIQAAEKQQVILLRCCGLFDRDPRHG